MLYILMIAAVAILDISIKSYIERYYWNKKDKYIFGKFVKLEYYHNRGGFLNVLQEKAKLLMNVSFAALGILMIVFVFLLGKKKKKLLKTGLALIIGGAISNEHDRFNNGYVTDYFSFSVPGIKNIVFNLGDMSIFAGIICLLCGYGELPRQNP